MRSLILVSCLLVYAWPVGALAPKLNAVRDWAYVLQNDIVGPAEIAAGDYDGIVMDYSKDGSATEEFSPVQIQQIKTAGKVALAYLSIGEAGSFRYYFDPSWLDTNGNPSGTAPSWLGPENPDFAGNFKVRYWEAGWQSILMGTLSGPSKSYLDRIIDQGFDGVYLDIIDAFEFWSGPEGGDEVTRLFARTQMKNLVKKIRDYARITRGVSDFLVFPQNGAAILYDDNDVLDSLGEEYLSLVDGIGAEDTWYNELSPQPQADTEFTLALLDLFHNHNGDRLVLAVDYVWDQASPLSATNRDRYNDFHQKARSHGFVPYAAVSDRNLDELVVRESGQGFLYSQPEPDQVPASVSSWRAY